MVERNRRQQKGAQNTYYWEDFWEKSQIKSYDLKQIKRESPFLKIVKNYINKYFPNKILSIYEFGCGSGNIAINLALDGHDVCATDLSKDVIDKVQQSIKNVEKTSGELKLKTDVLDLYQIDNYQFNNNYDLILNCSTIEYIDKSTAQMLLTKLFNITQKNGIFIFALPHINLISNIASFFYYRKEKHDRDNLSFYSMKELNYFIASSKYTLIKKHYLGAVPANTIEDYLNSKIFSPAIKIVNFLFYFIPEPLKKYFAFNVLVVLIKN